MWPSEVEILGVGFPKKIPGFNGLRELLAVESEKTKHSIFAPFVRLLGPLVWKCPHKLNRSVFALFCLCPVVRRPVEFHAMEFVEFIKTPKVDGVVLHRPFHPAIEGTLCLTGHHLILSSRKTNSEELWVRYPGVFFGRSHKSQDERRKELHPLLFS